jgi:hypothetical protein
MSDSTAVEREDARNRTSGEFGTKTHTAPETSLGVDATTVRVAELDRERLSIRMDRHVLEAKEFAITKEILSTFVHARKFDGVPHTLLVEDHSEYESGEDPFWSPSMIVDADDKVLWENNDEDDLFTEDLKTFTPLLDQLGTGELQLGGRGGYGIVLNRGDH